MGTTVVELDRVFDDDGFILDMVHANAPYWTTLRYVTPPTEGTGPKPPGSPWFRGDWAFGGRPLVEGAERILAHEPFHAAAREVFAGGDPGAVVRPWSVYLNLNTAGRIADTGHLDVPLYRGIDRNECGVQICHVMRESGLFERWRVPVATAVSWFSDQEGGAFTYWADGPDELPARHAPPFRNTALVSDNDTMHHRVEAVGHTEAAPGITVDSLLAPSPGDPRRWEIVEDGAVLGTYDVADVRLSVSWKAMVFADADDARRHDEHTDDLTLAHVAELLGDDLAGRGVAHPLDAETLLEPSSMQVLLDAYPRRPPRQPPA
ncbi:hypothetical protein [Rhabdothermincola salaria]|uniref:hypothetical protein n=1 Tax=Rhabdothermincola salaria TaxID=2903142 RepID=UPI001E507CF6|nr:hypothetical protein [Rhabdothermincola salaria]MCD9623924.1 hypothetical protein [Rhabdothermincola salaria]